MMKKYLSGGLFYLLKLLIAVVIICPVLYAISASFMTNSALASWPPNLIPPKVVFTNYQMALRSVPLFKFLINSLIVCAIVITAQVITASCTAYAFSFFEFKGRNILFMVVLATMMIPQDATIIANFLTISQLKLTDTYVALVLPYLTGAMGIFLMRQFYLTVPKELKEAATIDGCGDLRFLLNILMPISIPSIASLCIYVFIQTYNQFLWPLLVTNTMDKRTVQVGMQMLHNSEAAEYGIVLAGAVMVLIPSIVVFIIGQKYLIKGMTAGAVKG